ncbi:hypothetical protein [Roseivirga misakiensis]|uniref:Uncharacterized protein n=1 Tax=Roseivirga misakiensis TaxID=1563681 RepID=A0A1E5T0X3_9BACT|nr:hypothetical protein [Roseivirga misakiensis]OEK05032.1 hypothetical protein BFP71_16560 [Roseivirga misakiensis]
MKKGTNTKRKMSAIVALALAGMVTFTAGIQSYGIPKNEVPVAYDIKSSLERAYEDFTMEEYDANFIAETEEVEIINIYDSEDKLIKSIKLVGDDVIEDAKTKKLLNKADFLTSYSNTSIYKIN